MVSLNPPHEGSCGLLMDHLPPIPAVWETVLSIQVYPRKIPTTPSPPAHQRYPIAAASSSPIPSDRPRLHEFGRCGVRFPELQMTHWDQVVRHQRRAERTHSTRLDVESWASLAFWYDQICLVELYLCCNYHNNVNICQAKFNHPD